MEPVMINNSQTSISIRICKLFTLFTFLYASTVSVALDANRITRIEIDQIRSLKVLNDDHIKKVKQYVADQFTALFTEEKLSEIGDASRDLFETTRSKGAGQYAAAYAKGFAEAVKNAFQPNMQKAAALADKKRGEYIRLQIAIVAAFTDSAELIDELNALAQDKSEEIRLVSIKGLSMPTILTYFRSNDEAAKQAYQKTAGALKNQLAKETSALVISQIAKCALPETSDGEQLLGQCIAVRAKQYQSWDVKNEIVEWEMLKNILDVIDSRKLENSATRERSLMHSAAEIYNLAYQRYRKGMSQQDGDKKNLSILTSLSVNDLLTVILEGETRLLRTSRSERGPKMQSNIIKNKWTVTDSALQALIGVKGSVQNVFAVYPNNSSKTDLTVLPDPPAELIQNALNRLEIQNKNKKKEIIGMDQI